MRRPIRLALVRPQVDVQHKFSKLVESLALGYLTAALRQHHHDVVLLDGMIYNWTPEETASRICETEADIVGFTITLNHFPARLIQIIRLLDDAAFRGKVLVGGHAVSFFPERILNHVPRVDGVISGEGEAAIQQIASAYQDSPGDWARIPGLSVREGNGIWRNPPLRQPVLDHLPWPARDLMPEILRHDGIPCISTSRGCYARCSFCSVPRFYGLSENRPYAAGAWLCRSVEDSVAEIEVLAKEFGLRELLIVDDEFFGGNEAGYERALRFGQMLIERALPLSLALSCRAENVHEHLLSRLRDGGLSHVFVGLESGTEKGLHLYGKGHTVDQNRRAVSIIKSLGLSFQAGFMLFNPRSTLDDVRANLEFLDSIGECKPAVINSSVDPHFGAPMVSQMRRDGVLRDEGLRMTVDFLDARVASAKSVAELCATEFQPYMNLLAGLRSSVTWEWRRQVPKRGLTEEALLDRLERHINDGFAGIVVHAVEELKHDIDHDSILSMAFSEIAELRIQLEPAIALVLHHLENTEGEVRYWRQQDLISSEPAHACNIE